MRMCDNMPQVSTEIAAMIDMLPEQGNCLHLDWLIRMVSAWNSNFTKLIPAERERPEKSDLKLANKEV